MLTQSAAVPVQPPAQELLLALARQLQGWPLPPAAAMVLAELHLERAQRAQQQQARPPAGAASAAAARQLPELPASKEKQSPRPGMPPRRKAPPEAAAAGQLRAAERYLAAVAMEQLLQASTSGCGSQEEPDQAAAGMARALRARQQWALGRAAELRRDPFGAARHYAACRAECAEQPEAGLAALSLRLAHCGKSGGEVSAADAAAKVDSLRLFEVRTLRCCAALQHDQTYYVSWLQLGPCLHRAVLCSQH
jgi:hypothetical protein